LKQFLACLIIRSFAHEVATIDYGFGGYGTDTQGVRGLLSRHGLDLTPHEVLDLLVEMHEAGLIYLQNWDWGMNRFRCWREDWSEFFVHGFRLLDKNPA
jgi:hypothetical protein